MSMQIPTSNTNQVWVFGNIPLVVMVLMKMENRMRVEISLTTQIQNHQSNQLRLS